MGRDPDPAKGRVLPRDTGNCDQEEDNLLGRRRKGAGPGRRASSPSSRGPGRTPVGLGGTGEGTGAAGRRALPPQALAPAPPPAGSQPEPRLRAHRMSGAQARPLARRVRCPSAFPGAARRRSSEFRARTFPPVAPRAAPELPE